MTEQELTIIHDIYNKYIKDLERAKEAIDQVATTRAEAKQEAIKEVCSHLGIDL